MSSLPSAVNSFVFQAAVPKVRHLTFCVVTMRRALPWPPNKLFFLQVSHSGYVNGVNGELLIPSLMALETAIEFDDDDDDYFRL